MSRQALAHLDAVQPPVTDTCDSLDCALQWQRAQVWVALHSSRKIQTATDVMIQTYGVANDDPVYSFTIVREPVSTWGYSIRIGMSCGNLFGCSPSEQQLRNAFYLYIQTGRDVLSEAIQVDHDKEAERAQKNKSGFDY